MVMLGYRFIVWFHTVVAVVYTVLFPFVFKGTMESKDALQAGCIGFGAIHCNMHRQGTSNVV